MCRQATAGQVYDVDEIENCFRLEPDGVLAREYVAHIKEIQGAIKQFCEDLLASGMRRVKECFADAKKNMDDWTDLTTPRHHHH
jgi:hypothetical protein